MNSTLEIWIVECRLPWAGEWRQSLSHATFTYLLSKLLGLFLTAWERVDEVSNLDTNPPGHIVQSDFQYHSILCIKYPKHFTNKTKQKV